MSQKFTVKNPDQLRCVLVDVGVDEDAVDRMVVQISDDLKSTGEVFLWDGKGGFETITNHALAERRVKHGTLNGKPKPSRRRYK